MCIHFNTNIDTSDTRYGIYLKIIIHSMVGKQQSDLHPLAEMTAILIPPPACVLRNTRMLKKLGSIFFLSIQLSQTHLTKT